MSLILKNNHLHSFIAKSIAVMTLALLLNALSAPLLCAAGWCSSDAEETCTDCPCDNLPTQPGNSGDPGSGCPLAGGGTCSGLFFLVENKVALAEAPVAFSIQHEAELECPAGFENKLIRPPSFAC